MASLPRLEEGSYEGRQAALGRGRQSTNGTGRYRALGKIVCKTYLASVANHLFLSRGQNASLGISSIFITEDPKVKSEDPIFFGLRPRKAVRRYFIILSPWRPPRSGRRGARCSRSLVSGSGEVCSGERAGGERAKGTVTAFSPSFETDEEEETRPELLLSSFITGGLLALQGDAP